MTHLLKNSCFLLSLSLLALVSTTQAQTKQTRQTAPKAQTQNSIDPTPSLTPKFADVPAEHWASAATGYMLQQGIMEGNAHDLFRGNDPLNRYEFAVSIARLLSLHLPPLVPPPYDMSNPATKDDLNEVLERLTKIEKRLDALEQKTGTAPATAATPNDTAELKDLRQDVVGVSQQLASSLKGSSAQK